MGVAKLYLTAYNVLQTAGWSYLLCQTVSHLAAGGSYKELHPRVAPALKIFQTGALLEVVHAVLGLVRSNPIVTLQQVASRIWITWLVLEILPPSRASVGVPLILFAWSITEIIRYSMYAINLVGPVPFPLTWLRYTFFIVAYPVGVAGELLCAFSGLEYAKAHKVMSVDMPNRANFAFSYHLAMIAIMLFYIPGFPPMYMHMFAQRKKVLGGEKKDK